MTALGTQPAERAHVQPAEVRAGRLGTILGWGAYLGCSWTWCIGMFLPVLLARDYGVWSFAVFALPNVVGAAAFGWIFQKPPAQVWIKKHGSALTWFMRATLVFQWFFLGWLAASAQVWWIGLAVLLVGGLWPQPGAGGWRWISAGMWVVSVACAGVYLMRVAPGTFGTLVNRPTRLPSADLVFLAPVCAFGFALSPYLDLTFHHARRQMKAAESRAAFGVGFGVFFFSMIGFTFLYTPLLIGGGLAPLGARTLAAGAIVVHITLQIAFTTFAFFDAFDRLRPARRAGFGGMSLLVLLLIGYAVSYSLTGRSVHGQSAPELVYRCFMALYGLVFPAYVWVCMIPRRGTSGRGSLAVFCLAVTAAAPCYWLGFIEGRTPWLAVGLGVVLLARLLVRAGVDRAGAESR